MPSCCFLVSPGAPCLGSFLSTADFGGGGGAGDCSLALVQVDQGSCWAGITSPEDVFPFSFGQIVPTPKDRAAPGAFVGPLWAYVRIFAWALLFLLSVLPFPLCHGRCQRHPFQPVLPRAAFTPPSPVFSTCLASALAGLPWFVPSGCINPLARRGQRVPLEGCSAGSSCRAAWLVEVASAG